MLKIDAGLVASATGLPDPAQAVADELARARSAQGPQRLRNEIERNLARRWTHGDSILDIGIGTGRISLSLATADRQLTGLDLSRPMIERCRVEARDGPVELIVGDLRAMPFADGEFTTVMLINTLRHGPAWDDHLAEALRVTRPGGRLLIDADSLDHIEMAGASRTARARATDEVGRGVEPVLRLSVAQILEFARAHGASIRAIVPYGAVFGSALENRWLSGRSAREDRLLDHLVSWIGADQELYAFASFIERRIVGELTPRCAAHMMIVLERLPNDTRSADTLERFARLDEALTAGSLDLNDVAGRHERGAQAWAAEFARHLVGDRNRAFAAVLLDRLHREDLGARILVHLPPAIRHELEQKRLDARATAQGERLADILAHGIGAQLDFHGVSIGWALVPALGRELGAALRAKL